MTLGMIPGMIPSLPQLTADFALLDDANDRYDFLLDLAQMLPVLPEAERTEANLVRGCQSKVWVSRDPAGLAADSDSVLVRGLLVLLLAAAAEPVPPAPEPLLQSLGLAGYISGQRRNGMSAAAARIALLSTTSNKVQAIAKHI